MKMCLSKYSFVSTMSKVAIEITIEFKAVALLGNKIDDNRGRKAEIYCPWINAHNCDSPVMIKKFNRKFGPTTDLMAPSKISVTISAI